jgi:hypothetical protein
MQTTIFIRKRNEERWQSITDKSAWVNAYLEKSPPNSIVEKKGLEPVEKPLKETAFQALKERFSNGMCKIHELPLDGRGKCLQKGCKYA